MALLGMAWRGMARVCTAWHEHGTAWHGHGMAWPRTAGDTTGLACHGLSAMQWHDAYTRGAHLSVWAPTIMKPFPGSYLAPTANATCRRHVEWLQAGLDAMITQVCASSGWHNPKPCNRSHAFVDRLPLIPRVEAL